jgi:hypothetical protein
VILGVLEQNKKTIFQKIKAYWQFLKNKQYVYLLVLVFFGVFCLFELSTGYADKLMTHQVNLVRIQQEIAEMAPWAQFLLPDESAANSYLWKLLFSFMAFGQHILRLNALFLIFAGLTALAALFIYSRASSRKNDILLGQIKISFWSMALLFFFYNFAVAKIGVINFAARLDAMYGVFFYGALLLGFAVVYILNKFPKMFVLMPLLLSVLFLETARNSYAGSDTAANTTPQEKYQIVTSWLKQIQDADRVGKREVSIKVPENLEINTYGDNFIGRTLHKHQMLIQTEPIKVRFERAE